MKKQMKQIAAVLLVLAAVLISGCTEQMSADQIAARMEAKQENRRFLSHDGCDIIVWRGN